MPLRPLRIAHRGMPRRHRENTLASFTAALESGADGLELDVHATADGVVVVHHDARTADGLAIASVSSHDLDAGAARRGFRIPMLGEVSDLAGERAELFVEIKGPGIERAVLDALAGRRGATAIHSFDHALIARLARIDGSLRLGLLFEDPVPDPGALLRAHGAHDAWPHHSLVDERLVAAVRGVGGRVVPWTVNDRRDIARLTALGVDGICTDDVTLLG